MRTMVKRVNDWMTTAIEGIADAIERTPLIIAVVVIALYVALLAEAWG